MSNDQDFRDNAQIDGTGEIRFAPTDNPFAPLSSLRWRALGNMPQLQYTPTQETREGKRYQRGMRKRIKQRVFESNVAYTATLNEFTHQNSGILAMADPLHDFGLEGPDNSQSAIAAVAGTPYDFDEGSDGAGVLKYDYSDIFDGSGKRVRQVTSVTLVGTNAVYGAAANSTALLAGVDYLFDPETSQIQWLRDIADDVITPTITAPAITSTSVLFRRKLAVLTKAALKGFFRLYIWDDSGDKVPVLSHEDFYGQIRINSGYQIGDQQAQFDCEITVAQPAGVLWTRNSTAQGL